MLSPTARCRSVRCHGERSSETLKCVVVGGPGQHRDDFGRLAVSGSPGLVCRVVRLGLPLLDDDHVSGVFSPTMTQTPVLPSNARVSLAAAEVASRPARANCGWNCMSNRVMTAMVAALSMIAGDLRCAVRRPGAGQAGGLGMVASRWANQSTIICR